MPGEVTNAKLDKDVEGQKKTPLRVVPPILDLEVSGPLSQGAQKYGSYNWRHKDISLALHLEAIERHLAAYKDGENRAPDSGFTHLAHAAATIAILMDAGSMGTLIDDRVYGPAGKVLAGHAWDTGAPLYIDPPEAVLPLGPEWFKEVPSENR